MSQADQIKSQELSLFENIAETGVHESLMSLSRMFQGTWSLFPQKIRLLSAEEINRICPEKETARVGGDLALEGDIPISLLYTFSQESAINLTHCMADSAGLKNRDLPSLEVLAVAEISNILGNTFLNVIANTLRIKLLASIPRVISGTRRALFSKAAARAKISAEHIFVSDLKIESENIIMSASFALITNGETLKKLAEKIQSAPELSTARVRFF
ncbi:MAG: hypothetical protein NTW04_06225 [Elusimicrobia bacterium]|nr:hypothetical protein [Elusimicrobiota bacterium]